MHWRSLRAIWQSIASIFGIQAGLPASVTIHRVHQSDANRALTNVFRRGKPICGALSDQSQALFTTEDDR